MDNNRKIYQQTNNEMDFPSMIRALIRNWWVILLCGCITGMWVYMAVSFFQKPVYVSEATLIISNSGRDTSVYTDDAYSKVGNQYQKILTSRVFKNTIKEKLGLDSLPGELSAYFVPNTNIITISGTAGKPGDAYLLVKSATENYSSVSDYVIPSFFLEILQKPVIPRVPSNYGAAVKYGLYGLLFGIAAVALLIMVFTFLRDDIKNVRQVERLLDTSLFACLYYEKKRKSNKKESILINTPSTSFFFTENIRKMATKLDYKAQKKHHKIILVTSIAENEGKSTVSANLALALARNNRKVLLVDADLRKPALNKVLEKKVTPEMEFGAFLSGKSSLQDVLTRDKETGLYYLFGTKAYRRADAMLNSDRMNSLLRSAVKVVDYVIVDSSPMNITSDAEILAEKADGVLMVVRQCASLVPDINDALDTLKKSGTEVYGCVLNGVHTKVLPTSAEYGYDYGTGYGSKYSKYSHYVGRKAPETVPDEKIEINE